MQLLQQTVIATIDIARPLASQVEAEGGAGCSTWSPPQMPESPISLNKFRVWGTSRFFRVLWWGLGLGFFGGGALVREWLLNLKLFFQVMNLLGQLGMGSGVVGSFAELTVSCSKA